MTAEELQRKSFVELAVSISFGARGLPELTTQKAPGRSISSPPCLGVSPHSLLHPPRMVGQREELPLLAPVPLQPAL